MPSDAQVIKTPQQIAVLTEEAPFGSWEATTIRSTNPAFRSGSYLLVGVRDSWTSNIIIEIGKSEYGPRSMGDIRVLAQRGTLFIEHVRSIYPAASIWPASGLDDGKIRNMVEEPVRSAAVALSQDRSYRAGKYYICARRDVSDVENPRITLGIVDSNPQRSTAADSNDIAVLRSTGAFFAEALARQFRHHRIDDLVSKTPPVLFSEAARVGEA